MPERLLVDVQKASCPYCGQEIQWVATEFDREELSRQGLERSVLPEIVVDANRRLFLVGCPCGQLFAHVYGETRDSIIRRMNYETVTKYVKDSGGKATPPRLVRGYSSMPREDFFDMVRETWGRKARERLADVAAGQGINLPIRGATAAAATPTDAGVPRIAESSDEESPDTLE